MTGASFDGTRNLIVASLENPSVVVRSACEADMESVWRIYAYEILHGFATFEEEVPTLEEMQRRRMEVRAAGLPYLVAELEGQVRGYSYAAPYRTRPAYRYTLENSVYVAPEAHRRGVGRQLLGALIRECESGPWHQMVASSGTVEMLDLLACTTLSASQMPAS